MATLAPSLVRARVTIDARWPERDRTSDGWIGDAAHQARASDHNPNARGRVDAIDVDKDGIHMPTLIAACLVHPATHYVIHDRRIYERYYGFRPRIYEGDNPHTGHLHVSIMQSVTAENDPTPWSLLMGRPIWPVLREGIHGSPVVALQAILNGQGASLHLDGQFGPATAAAVRAFQVRHNVSHSVTAGQGDGVVGPYTRIALFVV
jgi:hypothetical protein